MYMKKELLLKTIHLKHHTSFSWLLNIVMLNKNLIQISKKSLERNVARYLYKSPIPITTKEVA